MINSDPNMSRKQIFKELPLPSKVKDEELLRYIYKGVFIAVKLLLDSRLNIVKISEGKKITTRHKDVRVENAVIKDTDDVKVESNPEKKDETQTTDK